MPKFTYSAAKGIEQSNGSGFIIQDVPISRSIANSGTAYTNVTGAAALTDTEEVIIFDLTQTVNVTSIPDGGTVGEQKIIMITAQGGSKNLVIGGGGPTISSPAAGSVHMIVWNGSAWKALS